jgi:hypothetical protein
MIGYQFLLEIDAQTQEGVDITLRYCCAPGYTGGGYTWEPYIVDPGLTRFTLFSGNRMSGVSESSYGNVVLGNFKSQDETSGPLDRLKTYRFYSRGCRMYVGLPTAPFSDTPINGLYGGFRRIYTAVLDTPSVNWDTVDFGLRSRQTELDVPFDTGVFLGNNVLPDGLEGNIDLKDKIKSALLGRAFNFPLAICNSVKLIYAASPMTGLSVNEINSDFHIFDNGIELYCSAVVANIETAVSPPSGQFLAASDGYIRCTPPIVGPLTCSAASRGNALTAKPSNLIAAVLTDSGYADMIDSASFAAFAAIDGYERGIYLTNKPNVSTIIDSLMAPLGYWYFSPTGKMVLGAVTDPANLNPIFAFGPNINIKSVVRRPAMDTEGGAPASRATVRYGRNYTVQAQPAGDVSAERKAWLADEWRLHSVDADPATIQPISKEMIFDSACTHNNDFHAPELAALFCVERELVDIELELLAPEVFLDVAALVQGDCVTLDLNGRFGYSGKHMIVAAGVINWKAETATITLWG